MQTTGMLRSPYSGATIFALHRLQGLCAFPLQTESAGKKTSKNKDIGAMFKSASKQTPSTKIVLEERTVREAISAHAASDCDLLYRSHAEKVYQSAVQIFTSVTCADCGG